MPFRQSLRSAFLKFPCGHGGSQFTSRRDESGLLPPSRVYPPQTGPSDTVSTVPPAIQRTRRTPGVHKDPSHFLGSEDASSPVNREQANGGINCRTIDGRDYPEADGVVGDRRSSSGVDERTHGQTGGGAGRVHHLPAIGPDYDLPSDVRDPEHLEHIGDPTLDRANLDRRSPLRGEIHQRYSVGSETSDYSTHSITHSLGPTTANRGTNASPHEPSKPRDLAKPQTARHTSAVHPRTGIEKDFSDINLDEGQRDGSPVISDTNYATSPAGYSGLIDNREHLSQSSPSGQQNEIYEPVVYKTISGEDDKEDGHKHRHAGLCADEIAQGITSKQQQNAPVTTSVETTPLEPVVHTRIQPIEREEVINLISRETHTTHILPTIQPIVDQTHLPPKHFLEREPGSGKLVEISAGQAERSGWDEIWHGDWVLGRDSGVGYDTKVEERSNEKDKKRGNKANQHQHNAVLEPPYEGPYETDGATYEMYGSGEIIGDSTLAMPAGYGAGYKDSRRKERLETMHMPGSFGVRSTLVGQAY